MMMKLPTFGTWLAGMVFSLPCLAQASVLGELIADSLRQHPALQAQQSLRAAAQADVRTARAQFYPTAGLAVEQSRGALSANSPQDSRQTVLSLQQPLWTGGRLSAELDQAKAAAAAQDAAANEARQALALQVVQAYGDWLGAQGKIAAYRASVATHQRMTAMLQRRVQQGAAATSDLVLTRARLDGVSADLALEQTRGAMALARLEQLSGQPLAEARLLLAPSAARAFPADPAILLAQALAVQPVLQRTAAQAAQKNAAIQARRAALQPELSLRLEQQLGAAASSGAGHRISLNLTSHFGPGLSSLAAVDGARAQYQAALEDNEAARRTFTEQLRADHALASVTQTRIGTLGAMLEATRDILQSYDRQFLAGKRSWLDVMNAARELCQAEVQLADVRATEVVLSWRLAIYTGIDLAMEEARQ